MGSRWSFCSLIFVTFIPFLLFMPSSFAGDTVGGRDLVKVVRVSALNRHWPDAGPVAVYKWIAGSGFAVNVNGRKFILTNAHVVFNPKQINLEGRINSSGTLYHVDHEVDLALIDVHDKGFFDGVKLLPLSEDAHRGQAIRVLGFPQGEKLERVGTIGGFFYRDYSHSDTSNLIGKHDIDIETGISGGPVVKRHVDECLGLHFARDIEGNKLGRFIPTEVINHFLKGLEDGPENYRGFADLGIKGTPIDKTHEYEFFLPENPSDDGIERWGRRETWKQDSWSGIRIRKIAPLSNALKGDDPHLPLRSQADVQKGRAKSKDTIKVEDLIIGFTDASGHMERVRSGGRVRLKNGSTVDFNYAFKRAFVGDKVVLHIVRDRRRYLDVTLTLSKRESDFHLVPNIWDQAPSYAIVGNVIFKALDLRYLQGWKDWKTNPAPKITALRQFRKRPKEFERQQIVVFDHLIGASSDGPIGKDYNDTAVQSVNGVPINNLQDIWIAFYQNTRRPLHEVALYDNNIVRLPRNRLIRPNYPTAEGYIDDCSPSACLPGYQSKLVLDFLGKILTCEYGACPLSSP